jgi:SAM-dependent methyltransferase
MSERPEAAMPKPAGSDRATAIAQRQQRERAYHRAFAEQHRDKAEQPVLLDVIAPGPRRPWNGYWTAYDLLMAQKPAGKRVLVPGCGFGEDAIRLAALGAEVHASDLSPELLEIARRRAARMGLPEIRFDAMPAEALSYPDDFFDLVYFNDILHHSDILAAAAEAQRVLKPGGTVVANELYTHSALQRVRNSRLIAGFLHRRLAPFIYGTATPYITADERKIDERELALLEAILQPGVRRCFFLLLGGRLLPAHWRGVARFDHAMLSALGRAGRFLAGRVVIAGTVRK